MDEQSAKKSLGQHWLNDTDVLKQISALAEIQSDNTVLEIGPGLGSLTEILLNEAGRVIAVELDESLIAKLNKRFKDNPKLQIINEDIRRFDLRLLMAPYKVVANIPYYLTSYLIRLLSVSPNPPELCVLLVQKEVAQRLAAGPGDLSILGIMVQVYWEVSLGPVVPAILFTPPPKVDSRVVRLVRRRTPLVPQEMEKNFFKIVRVGFSQKRKTLLNCLSGGLQIDKESIRKHLDQADIGYNARPQELSLSQWQDLARATFKDSS